jgi:hypothetical protein
MQLSGDGSTFFGWYGSLGTSLLQDKLALSFALDGPFAPIPKTASANQTDYAHAKAILNVGEGILGGLFFDASYEKYFLGINRGVFTDLGDPTNAIIVLDINYRTGASVLTLQYNASWDPNTQRFNVSSSLQASVKF